MSINWHQTRVNSWLAIKCARENVWENVGETVGESVSIVNRLVSTVKCQSTVNRLVSTVVSTAHSQELCQRSRATCVNQQSIELCQLSNINQLSTDWCQHSIVKVVSTVTSDLCQSTVNRLVSTVGSLLNVPEKTSEKMSAKISVELTCVNSWRATMGWLRTVGALKVQASIREIVSFIGLFCKRDLSF